MQSAVSDTTVIVSKQSGNFKSQSQYLSILSRTPASNYILDIGTNIIEKANGSPTVFNLDGKPLLNFRVGNDGQLLLNCELRDGDGRLLARMANNSVVFPDPAFERYGDRTMNGLRNAVTKTRILEVTFTGLNSLKIRGLFTYSGGSIVVDDTAITQLPNNNVMSGNRIRTTRDAFEFTDGSIGIG